MKESALWKKVKKALEEAGGRDLWLQRIESWSTPSIPDVLGIYKGYTFWIELKVAPVKFRPGQKIWLHKWHSKGGNCFTLVACKNKGFELYLTDYYDMLWQSQKLDGQIILDIVIDPYPHDYIIDEIPVQD